MKQMAALGIGLISLFGLAAPVAGHAATFGTMQRPRPCPESRALPVKGPPTIAQAKTYFYCTVEADLEPVAGRGLRMLADRLDIKIAPRARKASVMDLFEYRQGPNGTVALDQRLPVYDIKATYVETTCHEIPQFETGRSCTSVLFPPGAGLCFRDTFGDWHCRLHRDSWRTGRTVTGN